MFKRGQGTSYFIKSWLSRESRRLCQRCMPWYPSRRWTWRSIDDASRLLPSNSTASWVCRCLKPTSPGACCQGLPPLRPPSCVGAFSHATYFVDVSHRASHGVRRPVSCDRYSQQTCCVPLPPSPPTVNLCRRLPRRHQRRVETRHHGCVRSTRPRWVSLPCEARRRSFPCRARA